MSRREADRTRARRRRPDRPGVPRGRPRRPARGDRLGRPRRVASSSGRRPAPASAPTCGSGSAPPTSPDALGRADVRRRARSPDRPPRPVRATGRPRSAPATGRSLPHPRLLARAMTRPLRHPARGGARRHVPRRPGPDRELGPARCAPITGDDWPSDPLWICTVRTGRRRAGSCSAARARRRPTSRPRSRRPPRSPGTSSRSRSTGAATSTVACTPRRTPTSCASEDLDLVLVSSPMSTSRNAPAHQPQPARSGATSGSASRQEVRRLQRRGIPVVVFQPSAADQDAMGGKAMDPETQRGRRHASRARPRCAASSTDATPTASRCSPRDVAARTRRPHRRRAVPRHGATRVPEAGGPDRGRGDARRRDAHRVLGEVPEPQLRQHPQPRADGLEDRHRRRRDDGEPVVRPLPRLARPRTRSTSRPGTSRYGKKFRDQREQPAALPRPGRRGLPDRST